MTDVFVLCNNGDMMQIMSRRHYALKFSTETWNSWFSSSEWPYDTCIDMEGGWCAVGRDNKLDSPLFITLVLMAL